MYVQKQIKFSNYVICGVIKQWTLYVHNTYAMSTIDFTTFYTIAYKICTNIVVWLLSGFRFV